MATAKKSKKSKKVIIVRLVPEEPIKDAEGKVMPVRAFYTTKRNTKMEGGHNGKLRKRKFYAPANKHVWFIEEKISKSKK